MPKTAVNYDAMFKCLAKKYNKCHKEPLPDVMTPHTMRHTLCTRMANAGMNPKALQYIMGHANIVMTLNYYAHATFHSAQEEMERLQAKAKPTAEAKPEPAAEKRRGNQGGISSTQNLLLLLLHFESENMRGNKKICEVLPI